MASAPEQWFAPYLAEFEAAAHLHVAFSGGLDSTVLLHSLCAVVGPQRLTALHVNHQLSANSAYWQQHCRALCAALSVDFKTRDVAVVLGGEGVEQAARHARYQVFEEVVGESELLLLAHHQDDQLETIVYRMMRGSGPKGLAGMPRSRAIGSGRLLRPLLDIPRASLLAYAEAQNLNWVEDEANQNPAFDRNFLRHELIPQLAQHWPDYRQRLLRTAAQCAGASTVLQDVAAADLVQAGEQPELEGWSVAIAPLQALPRNRQLNLLSEWLLVRGIAGGGHRVFAEVLDTLLPARSDGNPRVQLAGGEFRRFQGRLYLLPPQPSGPFQSLVFTVLSPSCLLPDDSMLCAQRSCGSGALAVRPGDQLEIRFRLGGERCRPFGRAGSASLKKLLNEYGVAPWLRDRLPLIHINGELAAVAGLFVCRDFAAVSGEEGWSFTWHLPASGRKSAMPIEQKSAFC